MECKKKADYCRWKAGKKAGGRWKLRKKSCLTKILARWEANKRNNKNRDEKSEIRPKSAENEVDKCVGSKTTGSEKNVCGGKNGCL